MQRQNTVLSPLPATQAMAVNFDGVSKSYGARPALRSASLAIPRGQVVALVGPNGAGKTTLIEILMGLRKADTGTVQVLGCDVSRDRSYLAKVGVQLQETHYYPAMSARDYAQLFRGLYADCLSVRELASMFDLDGFMDQPISKLSGGQRQRVGLALALLHNPDLLILDEPTVGLDPIARRSFWNTLRQVHGQGARTILFSTHYMEEAEALASAVLVIAAGRIVAAGTVAEIRAAAGEQAASLDDAYDILVSRSERGAA